ncbi:MAG: ParB/RepB/Spo0J family partition protein [Candidatus Calescibacterium sp.]|nr:ParB/RepB/Spo0J family partition protein [Candidatus Calescibacterium sp.]MCX7734169.1 ParB/RepB/Spo0J family partition protein [bacterium]MDW8087933.1 ParB/RepB/Spo0J family partition protein [Candidatus Calescibacterium sp.]
MALDGNLAEYIKSVSSGRFLQIRDEYKGYDLYIAEIPTQKLEVVVYQRKPSKPHVKSLIKSISTVGFVVPLVVAKKPGEDKFIILDGQHRYLACLDLGIRKLPCVIIPWEYATLMINLNIEKQPNIKEKSYVALRVYNELVDMFPDKRETDDEILQSVEEIYFVTVGMVYEKEDKFSGSSWEPILKKTDWPFDLPLKEAKVKREKRAQTLEELHLLVKEIVSRLKDIGISHPFVYKEVVSYANPIKRQRAIVEFDEIFSQVKEKLINLRENPEELKGAIGQEESLE